MLMRFTPLNRLVALARARFASEVNGCAERRTTGLACQWPTRGPRWWPTRVPTSRDGLALRGATSCAGAGLAHAVALAVGGEEVVVVQQPVGQADGSAVVGQEPAPFLERPVAGDGQAAALVGGGDKPEQ